MPQINKEIIRANIASTTSFIWNHKSQTIIQEQSKKQNVVMTNAFP